MSESAEREAGACKRGPIERPDKIVELIRYQLGFKLVDPVSTTSWIGAPLFHFRIHERQVAVLKFCLKPRRKPERKHWESLRWLWARVE
jgi:hypothetical protein